jgi:hypothetical protein
MPNRIVLAWKVLVAGTPLSPAAAATKLAAVQLYSSAGADPTLGQAMGLTVASDTTANDATSATRTLTLNMTAAVGAPTAPPPFPCHPDTPTPPGLPFVLRRVVPLAGDFVPINGSLVVATSANQKVALNAPTDVVEFASQQGVFYSVAVVGAASITLAAPFTGTTGETTASKVVSNPSKIPALYSSSPDDTAGFATVPAVAAGPGARTVSVTYLDSAGAGPFTVVAALSGRRPAAIALAGGSVDIAEITDIHVASVGGFGNSVGQVTLCDLSSALPAVPSNATPAQFLGPLTDLAQALIDRALAYMPPSYFALAQQGTAHPQLAGDFVVTTGSTTVFTTVDQTGTLAAGNAIQFAAQMRVTPPFGPVDVTYTIADVTPNQVVLTTPYMGLDHTNKFDANNPPMPTNVTAHAQKQPTGAFLVTPSPAAPPSNAQLGAPLAQYVNPGNAVPPPNAPLPPQAMTPSPTLLSGAFTHALALALAVPVEPQPITFA